MTETDDIVAIQALYADYAYALDTKDWDAMKQVFAPEVVGDFAESGGIKQGYDAVLDQLTGVAGVLDGSHHLIGNFRISFTSRDAADVLAYVQAQHIRHDAEGGDQYLMGGMYRDKVSRTENGWRLTFRSFTPVWAHGNPAVFG
ncbi:nuclear transport factor 2 family protein [Nocardia aurantia]|uniref:SnoaL-like domain-containing protein n=1 Tax=Nocardia aurantia TaxID=2585199 RepID=A0A7K0E1A6_9NOCA|nr:nuclear transport factor 2 family protein [Nocardia aurantia]MQY31866.1 hypothetical protein [Nocardia aurantia]